MGKFRTTMIAAATAVALSVTLSACAPASPGTGRPAGRSGVGERGDGA